MLRSCSERHVRVLCCVNFALELFMKRSSMQVYSFCCAVILHDMQNCWFTFTHVLQMLSEDACSLFLCCVFVTGDMLGCSLFSSTPELFINSRRVQFPRFLWKTCWMLLGVQFHSRELLMR